MINSLLLEVPIITVVIIAIGLLMLFYILRIRRSVLPVVDERTRRATEHAAYYAFMIGLWFNIGFTWIIFLGPKYLSVPEIEAETALILSVLASSVLFVAFLLFFLRKENV